MRNRGPRGSGRKRRGAFVIKFSHSLSSDLHHARYVIRFASSFFVTDPSAGLVAYDDDSQSDSEKTSPIPNVRIPQPAIPTFGVFPSCSMLFVSVSARIKS